MRKQAFAKILLNASFILSSICYSASSSAIEFDVSGFASLIGGESLGACKENNLASRFREGCTRYVVDWAQAAVYRSQFSLMQESHIGLQGVARFSDDFSATVQGVARTANGGNVDLEWAFLSYSVTPSWTIQVGRKRLPIFFYSDFQDVGFAYTWIRPPADIYGWEVVNYNGISATYRDVWNNWQIVANFLAGNEKNRENRDLQIFSDTPYDISWNNILGSSLELNKDWFTLRLTYIQSRYKISEHDTGTAYPFVSGVEETKQKIYGASLNIDYDAWLVRSEYSVIDRYKDYARAINWMAALGYHVGDFTPMITFSRYGETTQFPDLYSPTVTSTRSFTLRYDLNQSSDIKIQYDQLRDKGQFPLTGNSNLISVSFDTVF